MGKRNEKTMILWVRQIAHVNLLVCVPVHASVIACISGNSMVTKQFRKILLLVIFHLAKFDDVI